MAGIIFGLLGILGALPNQGFWTILGLSLCFGGWLLLAIDVYFSGI